MDVLTGLNWNSHKIIHFWQHSDWRKQVDKTLIQSISVETAMVICQNLNKEKGKTSRCE